MPNGEESVGRNLFLSRFGFHRERHGQLQEAEDREQKHYFKTKLLQHEITENYTDCCETWPCRANMQNMKVNLGIICFFRDLIVGQR